MFCTGQSKFRLVARNEGKIKSYDSCADVRAWSHDNQARGRYIRDWIKCDMPICVIPVCTVANYLRNMTWRCRGRSTPRCHPNCKSKVILDSICASCHAMQECLKNDESFEKYFEEEEFETSHWPCEKCLEALKSIKMFWRIISERILNISIPKSDNFESSCSSNVSVQNLAKAWQDELVQQAIIVKNLTPLLNNELNLKPAYTWKSYTKYLKKIITLDNTLYKLEDDTDDEGPNVIQKFNVLKCIYKDKATETNSFYNTGLRSKYSLHKRVSKCTSVKVKTVDFGGGTCKIDMEELNMYRNNLDYLQQRFNLQSDELRQLKSENIALKRQLQNISKKCVEVPSYSPTLICDHGATVIPKPYELNCEKDTLKDIDSEMIITLKNCEDENFKHISMLQVLHKTNGSIINCDNVDEKCCRKNEDPIEILTKVHNKFGAIVKRELTIANEQQNQKRSYPKETNVDTLLNKVHVSKSVCSCSTISSTSDMVFASTTEV